MARKKARGKRVSPLVALAQLSQALGRTAEHEAARRLICEKYGRKRPNGRVILCSPSQRELLGGRVPGAFKIIFDSEEDARNAASELSALGAPPMTPYLCPRSRRGHLHLKTLREYRFEKDC